MKMQNCSFCLTHVEKSHSEMAKERSPSKGKIASFKRGLFSRGSQFALSPAPMVGTLRLHLLACSPDISSSLSELVAEAQGRMGELSRPL